MTENWLHILFNTILIVICMLWVNYDLLKNSKEFWNSIKGSDKILQITEICIYIWIRLFPLVVLCDLVVDWTITQEAWYSLDAILFVLILGDLGHKYLDKTK